MFGYEIFLLFWPNLPLLLLMWCVGRVAEINCVDSTSSMSSILADLGLALLVNQCFT